MDRSRAIETALAAANSAILLNSPAQFPRAAKAWRRCKSVGLDTEFVRERTFFANLGLVQVSDGQTVWLVDPLVDGAFDVLRSLLEDQRVLKILHSPSEDLEVLQYAVGALPEPMLDTQSACALLGQPLQLGYHAAAKWLLDVEIDKDQTRSNWCARPLKSEQLRYAALDVCLLPLMWDLLRARLVETGRIDWCLEDCSRQLATAREPADPAAVWKRIRGHGRLDGVSLAILQALAEWRDQEARARNRPRGFIVPDPVLLNVARNKIGSLHDLGELEGLHPRARQRHGEALVRIVNLVARSGRTISIAGPLKNSQKRQLEKLRSIVKARSAGLGVEPALLASRRELEILVQNHSEWPERLQGWRREVVGDELRRALKARE